MGRVFATAGAMLLAACGRHPSESPAPPAPVPSESVAAQEIPPAPPASAPVSLPGVGVENIGIHIGGGPNDAATKAPIASSVEPHFDELRACWGSVEDPKRNGDFGVDLLIPSEGGHAKVSHPRTAIRGDAFRACVIGVFEGIEFKKPLSGRTTASYSLRFTP